jgi:20S proteasome alpha/beta subunit
MTFIASVIARDGVVIIADSLSTTVKPVIKSDALSKYYTRKKQEAGDKDFVFDLDEVIGLFTQQPHHTENYEDKLIQLDDYTAITTAGSANINNKRIYTLIENFKEYLKKERLVRKNIEEKVSHFCSFLTTEVKEHLKNNRQISQTLFFVTHYDRKQSKSIIYRVQIKRASQVELQNEAFEFLTSNLTPSHETIISGGVNITIEEVLWGPYDLLPAAVSSVVTKIQKDFNLTDAQLSEEYMASLINDPDIMSSFKRNAKLRNMKELSIQEAVNLAYLCLKIEMDFQNYSNDMPVVGGVIRIAIIDKGGFRFLSGDRIISPV